MATKGFALILVALLALSFFAGCIGPGSEAPLITSSRSFTMQQGGTERFRVASSNGTSTPEYSIYAENILNKTALFIIRPGDIPVALTEGGSQIVDLNGDGSTELVVAMGDTTGTSADVTINVAGAAQVCTNACNVGERQRPYPDCSCYTVAIPCPIGCAAGRLQRPYPDCTCYTENRTCGDGTLYGQCAAAKPMMCSNGNLVNNCTPCGCPAGRSCNASSGACYVQASATPTPTQAPGATPTPAPTPTPAGANAGAQAIAAAGATTEGALMSRLDTAYKKGQLCTQSEFTSTFTSRKQRAPTQNELSIYSNTKNYMPTGVNATATPNGSSYDVVYSATGAHGMDVLKVTVSSGVAGARQWLDGTTTTQNAQLLSAAEAVSGNCGIIFAMNTALN
ncbi:MAG: hypothetical protein PHF51_04915 [Candidatus ainarchaeum sp.]|nr:hypothetical protein [Candidatus ainarchaeum sp.]